MTRLPEQDGAREALCPHCKQTFRAEPLDGPADRYQGFKCPHCRLFVALGRADLN
ncbi:MAG: hypothetical protein ICV59_02660 [Thermoleophilia bacterium]|nr:hypothetical protein [Thermoleophilia bacterium]